MSRWKALHELDKQQRQLVEKSIREAKEKLEAELESAKNEHQLMLMTQGDPGFLYFILSSLSPYLHQPLVPICEHLKLIITTNFTCCLDHLLITLLLMSLLVDLMRRQEELRRLEELRNQELVRRKQIEMRCVSTYEGLLKGAVGSSYLCVILCFS